MTRGTTDITVTSAYNSDKTELVLTASTALAAGTYTVTVGSFDPVSFDVSKQVPTTLKINNTTVANTDGAKVFFQVLDQYGDVMPNYTAKKLSITAYNTTKGHSVDPAVNNGGDDYFTVKTGTQTTGSNIINAIDDTISIVAYLTDTPSVSCTAALKIVRVYTETFDFGEIALESDKRVTIGNRYVLNYSAKDNEGNAVVFENSDIQAAATSATVTIGDYTFVSGNPSAVPMTGVQIDAKKNLSFSANSYGTAVVTAVNNNTGKTSTLTIVVNNVPALAALDIADSSVAKNATTNDTFKAAVVAYDQFGEVIDAANLKSKSLTGVFTSINTNSLNAPIEATKFSADGKYIVYTVTSNLSSNYDGTAKFTFISTELGPNGTITSHSDVEIGDAAEPSALEIVKDPVTTAITGDKLKIQIAVKDQYQNKMAVTSLTDVLGDGNYTIDVDGANIFTVASAALTAVAGQTNVYEIAVPVSYTGNAADAVSRNGSLTLSLKEGAKVIDSKTFSANVGKEITSYEVTTNTDVYKAGDKITVTVVALSGVQQNTLLNADVKVKVEKEEDSTTKTTYETLTFKDGVATLELKANTPCTDGKVTVTNTKDASVKGFNADAYTILVGAAGKFALDGSGQLVFKDSEGNALDTGTGTDTSAYASYKLVNKTTGKEIEVTGLSDDSTPTLYDDTKDNQTIAVEIDNTSNTVTKLGANGSYNLTNGIYVKGITPTNASSNDVLEFTITINGVTWTSSVRYSGTLTNAVYLFN